MNTSDSPAGLHGKHPFWAQNTDYGTTAPWASAWRVVLTAQGSRGAARTVRKGPPTRDPALCSQHACQTRYNSGMRSRRETDSPVPEEPQYRSMSRRSSGGRGAARGHLFQDQVCAYYLVLLLVYCT